MVKYKSASWDSTKATDTTPATKVTLRGVEYAIQSQDTNCVVLVDKIGHEILMTPGRFADRLASEGDTRQCE